MTFTPSVVQKPQQIRSHETMTQILDAAARILETKTFEELTVTEVVHQAGTSVGAFYGRFKDKDGLLQALDERFFEELGREFSALALSPVWKEASAAEMIRLATRFLIDIYSRQKGLLRSLTMKARFYGDSQFKERERYAWDELFPHLEVALLRQRHQMRHPDPALAVRLGFQQLFFTLREVLLWEPLLKGKPTYSAQTLAAELSRAYLAYIGWEGDGDA